MTAPVHSIEALARQHGKNALETVVEIMNDYTTEPKDRLRAAELVLDRGHGKPTAVTVQIPATRRQAERLAAMTDEDLESIIEGEVIEATTGVPDAPQALGATEPRQCVALPHRADDQDLRDLDAIGDPLLG